MHIEEMTKEQLSEELTEHRQQIAKLKELEEKQKHAEEALRKSEERFRKVFDYSNDAIFVIDPEQDEIIDCNGQACSLLRYSREELLATPISAVHPKEMPLLQAFAKSVFEQGGGWTDELTCLTKSGETLPAEISASVIDIANRTCMIALVRDISERKQAEQSLRESEERYRHLVEQAGDAIFVSDEEGRIFDVNQQACDSLGYTRDKLLKMYLWELNPQRWSPDSVKKAISELVPGKTLTYDSSHRRKDGTYFPVEIRVGRFEAGGRELNLDLARDITERRQAEQALRESEERFRTIVENAADAFFIVDTDGWVVDVNQAACEILGYPRKELLAMHVLDYCPEFDALGAQKAWQKVLDIPDLDTNFDPKDRDAIAEASRKVAEAWKKQRNWVSVMLETSFRRKDGSSFPVEARMGYIELRGALFNFAIIRDITERKQAEAAIRESEERLTRILESAMDAIITMDSDRRIVLFNQAAEKVFRCSADGVRNKPITPYLSERFAKLLSDYLQDSKKHKKFRPFMWAPEGVTAIRADGEEFPIEGTISHFEFSGLKLYTIILRDINQRKQAEAELSKLQLQNIYLQEEIKSEYNFGEIIGATPVMKKVFKNIEKVAGTDSTVLLTGETGTGKELIARAIHNLSGRKDTVLVTVNCGALPGGLVESELFGHEKGAFTGATARKKGKFELADGGTIFLDEVGELPLDAQIKLLRVLQEQEFERVGGTSTLKVDVRIIAATNRNLEDAIKQGAFRSDFYYRLNIFPIPIPPLRERIQDAPLLTNYFCRKYSRRIGKRIDSVDQKALQILLNYYWPGNVRELANIIERAVIFCEGGVLRHDHVVLSTQKTEQEKEFPKLVKAERQHILKALQKTGGVLGGLQGAAELLGINRSALWSKMKKLGIET